MEDAKKASPPSKSSKRKDFNFGQAIDGKRELRLEDLDNDTAPSNSNSRNSSREVGDLKGKKRVLVSKKLVHEAAMLKIPLKQYLKELDRDKAHGNKDIDIVNFRDSKL